MKNNRRLWLKALAALPMAAALPAMADGLETIRQRGRLRVAVYNDFSPYSIAGGKGIDADIARAGRLAAAVVHRPAPDQDVISIRHRIDLARKSR